MINYDNLKTELKKNGFSFEFYKYVVNIFGILEHKALFDGISLCDTIEFYNNLGCINSEKLVIDRLKHLTHSDLKKLCEECRKKDIGYKKLEILYFNNIEAFEICVVYYLYDKFMNKYFD